MKLEQILWFAYVVCDIQKIVGFHREQFVVFLKLMVYFIRQLGKDFAFDTSVTNFLELLVIKACREYFLKKKSIV